MEKCANRFDMRVLWHLIVLHFLQSAYSSEIEDLASHFKNKAPKNWVVFSDKENSVVRVETVSKFKQFSTAPGLVEGILPSSEPFSFSFRVSQNLSLGEYDELAQKNIQIRFKIKSCESRLKTLNCPKYKGRYLPKTEKQKTVYNQLRDLNQSLYPAPNYVWQDLSLRVIYGFPPRYITLVQDEEDRKRCETIRDMIISDLVEFPHASLFAGQPD